MPRNQSRVKYQTYWVCSGLEEVLRHAELTVDLAITTIRLVLQHKRYAVIMVMILSLNMCHCIISLLNLENMHAKKLYACQIKKLVLSLKKLE